MSEKQNNDKVIKDAQYRKGLSIAFFNATNAAIALVAQLKLPNVDETLKSVVTIRNFFLEEHKTYYANVIAQVGVNYKASESIEKLKSASSLEELNTVWRLFSEDERHDTEIRKVANELNQKYKHENA